jgi:hypothetical protein
MSDNSMALVLSFLPNTTYDLPAFDLLLESGPQICGVPVDDLSLGVGAYGAKSSAGKSYVIFGKTDTSAIDLSKPGDKSKYTIGIVFFAEHNIRFACF